MRHQFKQKEASVMRDIGTIAILLAATAAAPAMAQQTDLSEAVKEEAESMNQAVQQDFEAREAAATGEDSSNDSYDASMSARRRTESSSSSSSERSSSRSSGFSFGWGGRNSSWSVDTVLGQWTIGDKDGSSTCSLTLYPDESFGLRRAWTTAGCPDGFFGVNRWRAAGRDLQLTDMSGKVIGSFRQVGPGRFEGQRQSDGAAIYLSR